MMCRKSSDQALNARMIEALQVTAQIAGSALSMPASAAMLQDLRPYGEDAVMQALRRCRRECRGRLALADIFARLPGAAAAHGGDSGAP